jgi:hypothetical protein
MVSEEAPMLSENHTLYDLGKPLKGLETGLVTDKNLLNIPG